MNIYMDAWIDGWMDGMDVYVDGCMYMSVDTTYESL